ncbi:hypothetical protein KUM39_27300 [Streptomyces sp. J2-1]|uniref:hypothetical protein n=1 Tax=Streptomyces corallincola TaxID=2851888 RepID=UPI001C37EF5F|nr:hypothetical protein [Streptomyces corallincola]MBV2358013.1 hypothetical protein [Streptomyces corallincola]
MSLPPAAVMNRCQAGEFNALPLLRTAGYALQWARISVRFGGPCEAVGAVALSADVVDAPGRPVFNVVGEPVT